MSKDMKVFLTELGTGAVIIAASVKAAMTCFELVDRFSDRSWPGFVAFVFAFAFLITAILLPIAYAFEDRWRERARERLEKKFFADTKLPTR